MITIHLPDELERFVFDAVRTGRYARADEVVSDGLSRLKQVLDLDAEKPSASAGPGQPGRQLTKQEFQRHLVEIGLIDPPVGGPEPEDLDRALIDKEGEIVSEVIIRERLIEWLTGFLKE